MTSSTFKQAMYAQETDEVVICLLTITSEALTDPVRVCYAPLTDALPVLNVPGLVSNGEEFVFVPFDIILPRDDKTGTVSAKLQMDNVEREVIDIVRGIRKPAKVKIQAILASDPDFIEMEYTDFLLSNVSYDADYVEGDLTLEYWALEPFPSGRFTPSGFPGLF